MSTGTQHPVESLKSWGVGDSQDAHYCLSSDFCLLNMITTGILKGPLTAFLAEVQKHCGGHLSPFPANVEQGGRGGGG